MFFVKIRETDEPSYDDLQRGSDITYVDFVDMCYVSYAPINQTELSILKDNKFVPVDGAIADIVMRFNCIAGCKTAFCCSGHPGKYDYAYIKFETVPDDVMEKLSACKYWFRDGERLTWRVAHIDGRYDGIKGTDWRSWMDALYELGTAPWLPENRFVAYEYINSGSTSSDGTQVRDVCLVPDTFFKNRELYDIVRQSPYGRTEI